MVATEEVFTDMIGKEGAKWIMYGALDNVTGLSISDRISIRQLLIFDSDREVRGRDKVLHWVSQLGGPTLGLAMNWADSADLVRQGKDRLAFEKAMPASVRNFSKAMRYSDEGVLNRKGHEILSRDDLNFMELLGQAGGFTPAKLSRQYDKMGKLKGKEQRILRAKRDLMDMYALARRVGDTEMMREAKREIRAFNLKHPEIRITNTSLNRSWSTRERHRRESMGGVTINRKLRYLADEE